jgi:tetratricopeptide (TPR) repeat protein
LDTMRRRLAESLNSLGSNLIAKGHHSAGRQTYELAIRADKTWSVPWYNLGLHCKNTGHWRESLQYNQRALALNTEDQAAWWNLGIAATALKDWNEARRAWKACGIALNDGDGEVLMPAVSACVRLDPEGRGEVVWGLRLDPARIVVMNVPLPESGYRFHDIILNDGASNGVRQDGRGDEVPVFDQLSLWKVSEYSTFAARLQVSNPTAEENLTKIGDENEIGIEDWSTVRMICSSCSRGNPGPHDCKAKPLEDGTRRFGFGAKTRGDLLRVLGTWAESNARCEFAEPEVLVPAVSV